MQYLLYLLVGGLAGWLGGKIMQGKSLGIIKNIMVGLVGGLLGGWLFDLIGIEVSNRLGGALLTATIGAILLLWIIRLIKK